VSKAVVRASSGGSMTPSEINLLIVRSAKPSGPAIAMLVNRHNGGRLCRELECAHRQARLDGGNFAEAAEHKSLRYRHGRAPNAQLLGAFERRRGVRQIAELLVLGPADAVEARCLAANDMWRMMQGGKAAARCSIKAMERSRVAHLRARAGNRSHRPRGRLPAPAPSLPARAGLVLPLRALLRLRRSSSVSVGGASWRLYSLAQTGQRRPLPRSWRQRDFAYGQSQASTVQRGRPRLKGRAL